jgi:hypothetical protein
MANAPRIRMLLAGMAALGLATVGHIVFADQTETSNCDPTPRVAGNCYASHLVPCSAGTCVSWFGTYGVAGPGCPNGGGTGAYFSSTVTATSWQTCGNKEGSVDGCTLNLAACANLTMYTDLFCRNECGPLTAYYCRATSNTRCP